MGPSVSQRGKGRKVKRRTNLGAGFALVLSEPEGKPPCRFLRTDMMPRMQRLKSGQDEFRFPKAVLPMAKDLAVFLPQIRKQGEEISGCKGPEELLVVISDKPPHTSLLYHSPDGCFAWMFIVAGLGFLFNLGPHTIWAKLFGSGFLISGLAAICFNHLAWRRLTRCIRGGWPHCGGMAVTNHEGEQTIALHWPCPRRSSVVVAALVLPETDQEWFRSGLAHEYGHCLLRMLRRDYSPSPWLDEGFAFWFMEQATDMAYWREEARNCVEEPEPEGDPWEMLKKNKYDRYMRLMARYYWEVRTLAEEGRLREALTAPAAELARLRPSLRVGE